MRVKNYDGDEIEVPEKPLSVRDVGGCICAWDHDVGSWDRNPKCGYHVTAESQPWNHQFPWNCPTYWDGCNCQGGPFIMSDGDC